MDTRLICVKLGLSKMECLQEGGFNTGDYSRIRPLEPLDIRRIGEWEWKLFQFDSDESAHFKTVVANILSEGWECAGIEHLLAGGRLYSRSATPLHIIAPGTIHLVQREPGCQGIPSVYGADVRKYRQNRVVLSPADHFFVPTTRFLAVRPVNVVDVALPV